MRLETPRLILLPMGLLDEAEHAAASRSAADAARDTRAADAQWREHGFGPWAIRDRRDNTFLGGAELRFAGEGIEGIAPDEVEAGWWVTEDRRHEGIATEAMQAAIADLWTRTEIETVTAYISGENEPSDRLAANLGFTVRGAGRGRSGEAMTVYELRRRLGSSDIPKEERMSSHQVIHKNDVEAKNDVFRPLTGQLGVAGFKINQLELAAGKEGPEHDHAGNGEEEVYAVIAGSGTLRVDGEDIPLTPGHFVYCTATARRQMIAGDEGLTWIGIGSADA